jgi:RNA polymerase sigma-70 factor (ECF subfamily)
MSDAASDVELLERIHRDDPGAFDLFVDRYGDRLYGFSSRMCGEREDARDTVQETLFQAFRSLKNLKEPKALRSWLYRVASNACLMQRRKGKHEPERKLSLDELLPDQVEGGGIRIPEDELLRGELQRRVREAIRTLPSHYRIVLVLRDMEQLSTREAAEALGLPESTIKMRLHRARLGVRRHLEQEIGGGEVEQ